MHIRKPLILAVLIFTLVSGTALAHHPGGSVGLGQAGPIRTATATTLITRLSHIGQ